MSDLTNMDWKRFIPTLNQRPTQPPLDRDQQKSAFEQLKHSYSTAPPPPTDFPVPPTKELKLTEEQQLKALRDQMAERGLKTEMAKVDERIEETQVADTIKKFYCTHVFQTVSAMFGILPVRYKICKKCGLVK